MKDRIWEFIKGIAIGIANVIPGFSGGTMAVTFGVYEKIIFAFSHFFQMPVKVMKDVWAIALGVIVGIVLSIFGIVLLLERFPVPTVLFFVGLILGSLPSIESKVNIRTAKKTQWILLFVGISAIVLLTLLPNSSLNLEINNQGIGVLVGLFVIGAFASATMVIPGVSGSLILLVFGYYEYTMGFISDFVRALVTIDRTLFAQSVGLVLLFGAGVVVGVVLISKLIERWMKNHAQNIYALIIGLLIASPFAIIVEMFGEYPEQVSRTGILGWIVGVLMFGLGLISTYLIEKMHPPKDIHKVEKEVDTNETIAED